MQRSLSELLRSPALATILSLGACASNEPETPSAARAPATLSQLPEGAGLAARYPEDHGLARDPAVVFADDIETITGETILNSRWDNSWGGPRIARDGKDVHAGRQALELRVDPPGGVGLSKYLGASVDHLFLRYYIKYDDAFPGAHHVGGAIAARARGVPEASPGLKPDGANKFEVLLDHWSFDPAVPSPGHLVAYVYHMDQQHQWGEQFYPSGRTSPGINASRGIFGPAFVPRPDIVPALGRWYANELMVQANTPGQRDGRVAFWVDGRLAADFPNLRFRAVPTLQIGRVAIGMYESRTGPRRRVWIDDVVVATTYIGPMVSPR